MSIPLMIETQSEVRRLLIAGSELAAGDFRLKKLLPQMKKAGEGVSVFARVAEAMEKVIEPGGEKVSEKLLELANIVNAILYTQGQTGIAGELTEIDSVEINLPTAVPFRRLSPVIDALTTKGSGRLEVIKEAYADGVFRDLRLVYPLIHALDDNYSDIAELVAAVLKELGAVILPVLKENFDFNGGKGYARRIDIISKLAGRSEKEFILRAVEEGTGEVRVSAVKALKDYPECEALLLELSKDRKKDIREASLLSLAYLGTEAAVKRLFDVFKSKERESAVYPVKVSSSKNTTRMLLDEAENALEILLKSEKGFSLFAKKVEPPPDELIESFHTILGCMEGKKDREIFEFLTKCLEHTKHLQQFKVTKSGGYNIENAITRMVAHNILAFETEEAFSVLDSVRGKYDNNLIAYSFEAALRSKDSGYVFDQYARHVKGGRKSYEGQEILGIMDRTIDFAKPFRLMEYYGVRPVYGRTANSDEEEIQWDHRWLKVLMDMDEMSLVCRLASEKEARCIEYLLKKLEANKNFNDGGLKDIVRGLLQARYPKIMDVILQILDHNFKRTGHYLGYYFNDFARVLRLLPSESAKGLEDFAADYNNEAAAKLFEVAQDIKGT